MSVYYGPDHAEEPANLTSEAEVRELFAVLRGMYPEGSVALLTAYLADDPWGAELTAGINGDRGVLRYSGDEQGDAGFYSKSPTPTNAAPVVYYFYTADREFPPHSEVPLSAVEAAVLDFMATGVRPASVEWQEARRTNA
ncbi:Imm1 family immunity protein [Saccharothrix coeruleofusca]|uniref:Imm1 family immunity protein n=1 Tax=Saccharothrix coeruleofusca TaxID=33919 RepID=UPI0016716A53|nr:Imm1 family immunity protein [Saccharothrix coeruleofusca]